jgi:N-acetylglutamate synthase-like GNAT family acetyltransferase
LGTPFRSGFRRATLADAAEVRALTRAAYDKWVSLIGREPKPMTADYEAAVVEHLVDLYESDGRLLGLVEMIPQPDHLLIENLAVHPSCQGKGLGDLLLKRAEERAGSLGLSETRLYTNEKFAANLAFYAKRGYSEFFRETFPTGAVAIHMRKPTAAGELSLGALLRNMRPELREGTFVFCTVESDEGIPAAVKPLLTFHEQEGITLVIGLEEAQQLGLRYQFVSRLITLTVHSSLEAVGFLAAITARLAEAGISVNAVSAFHHDHLFVPEHRADEALALLKSMSSAASSA